MTNPGLSIHSAHMEGNHIAMSFGSRPLKSDRMILLAPRFGDWHASFDSVEVDAIQHRHLLAEAQRLRARIYLQDGAIQRGQLSPDGRFVHSHDDHSWHLLLLDAYGRVSGCARYRLHNHHVSFSELGVSTSALARCLNWGESLRHAVESKRAEARRRGYVYAELGGWALIEEMRHTREMLRLPMYICGLMKTFGGALAVSTATIRNRSSSILRKLGGHRLHWGDIEFPTYYDPQYACHMEVLGFDSDFPNPKYTSWIQECHRRLRHIAVVCGGYGEDWKGPISTRIRTHFEKQQQKPLVGERLSSSDLYSRCGERP